MATTIPNRVISYFFIFDFYHQKGASDSNDLLEDSVVYFYSPKEDLKKKKLVDCGQIVGLVQFFKHDLFSCVPKEFNFKKSLVTCQHYGRHSAFLVLSKERFTTDEANIHLTHILQIFNLLYGTLNHIQSICSDIKQIQIYLKQVLTPIIEYVFNENRSIQNLFSAIDYASVEKNNRQYLLHVKHFLNYLQSTYAFKNGLIAYEKRILYSTFDVDTTYYLQVILELEQNLPVNETDIPFKSEKKLKSGVSLIRIYVRRPSSLEPILNSVNVVNANTTTYSNPSRLSKPINITNPVLLDEDEPTSLNISAYDMGYSSSASDKRHYDATIREDPAGSSEDTTGFETDRAESASPPNVISSVISKKHIPIIQSSESKPTFSSKPYDQRLTDDDKRKLQDRRSTLITSDAEVKRPPKIGQVSSCLKDSIDTMTIVQLDTDDSDVDCCPDDMIDLPPMASFSNFRRPRQRTITNYDLNDGEHSISGRYEGKAKWGDVSDKNDEIERNEFVLYIQRNSHMILAGIIEKSLISDEYLQNLWCLLVIHMADMDKEIQVIPTAGEISKNNTDVKFQFNENSRLAQFERLFDVNRYYYRTPSADSACMAFDGRTKLNENSERKMIGFSRGNHLISIKRYLPDRVNYLCRRFQEPQ